jgi:hypothetical protein
MSNPPQALENQDWHQRRYMLAGKINPPKYFNDIVLSLKNEDFDLFKGTCITAGIPWNAFEEADDNPDPPGTGLFIRQMWEASLAARKQQSYQPCW